MSELIATDGTWYREDRPAYFLAGRVGLGEVDIPYDFWLVAVNELVGKDGKIKGNAAKYVELLIARGARVLIDSGIFWLTNEHKRAHGISMDEALSLPPAQIDGFEWLWKAYFTVYKAFGANAWGYIELDQGGAVNKRITRAKLHDAGIKPMPVYHPLNDGWDYLDELASTHDRICMGNIVQARQDLRVRLFHTLSERHRLYPDLWVHNLGMTPNQWANGLPFDSCDSSTWLKMIRWGDGCGDVCMGKTFRLLTLHDFRYELGSDPQGPTGSYKAQSFVVASSWFQRRGLAHWLERSQDVLGLDVYPEPDNDMLELVAR